MRHLFHACPLQAEVLDEGGHQINKRRADSKGAFVFSLFATLKGDSQDGRYLVPWRFWSGMEKGFTGKGDMQRDT